MRILDFSNKFPNEESCRLYLKEKREAQGITCKCGCTKHYWFKAQSLWKCSKCGSRRALRAGTIMENSKLPLLYWFMTIHLLTSIKKSFSILELQRQLGHKRYEPIWYMRHKIRVAMGKRDANYKLKGNVEIDEGYFEVVNLEFKKTGKDLKRGKGSERQRSVLVMVESTPVVSTEVNSKKKKHTPDRKLGFVKMIVLDDTTEKSINYEVRKAIDRDACVDTDANPSYNSLISIVDHHNKMVVKPKEGHKKLPWVHTVISNAKKGLLGVHHSVGKDYLQNCLNEFVYKLNRRYEGIDLFDRLLVMGVEDTWY